MSSVVRLTALNRIPQGFTLEFHFSPNEHFTNTVLTKEYSMKCKPDDREPFTFEGPEIYKCKVGTTPGRVLVGRRTHGWVSAPDWFGGRGRGVAM